MTATLATRWDAARERAEQMGVRLQAVTARRHYQTASQSTDDTVYSLRLQGERWTCECPGYQFTGVCKHLAALQRRAEVEGWETRR